MKRLISALLALLLAAALPIGAAALQPVYNVSPQFADSIYYERLLAVPASENPAADFLNAALSQVGYHEGDAPSERGGGNLLGNDNYSESGYFYNFDGREWCAMFVSWCARQAAIPTSLIRSSPLANPSVFAVAGIPPGSYVPKPGDLVFFRGQRDWAHVAIVLAVDGDRLYTVEGNKNDAVRICCRRLSSEYIQAYGIWTERGCDFSELTAGRIYTLEFTPNGGTGRMSSVCAAENQPLQPYKNAITYDDNDGEPEYDTYMSREGYTFGGWYIERPSDGAWLTDGGFLSEDEIRDASLRRTILADAAQILPDASWSTDLLPVFRCHAVWLNADGNASGDTSAYIPVRDSSGWLNPYCDLTEDTPHYEKIREAVQGGLMNGMSASVFAPLRGLTRAEAVSALYRAVGEPLPSADAPVFTDVSENAWCRSAVMWATEKGIVHGEGDGRFLPDRPLSGYEALAILYRFVNGPEPTEPTAEPTEPPAPVVPEWAKNSLRWAIERSLLPETTQPAELSESMTRCAFAALIVSVAKMQLTRLLPG